MPATRGTIWRPSSQETQKLILSSPRQVTAMKLIASGSAALVYIYDVDKIGDINDSNLVWVMDASTADNDSNAFPEHMHFKKGLAAVCDQGEDFNTILCIAYVSPER